MPEGTWQDSWRTLKQLVASGHILSLGLLQILTWARCARPPGHSHVMHT